jgi:hypothetical protein
MPDSTRLANALQEPLGAPWTAIGKAGARVVTPLSGGALPIEGLVIDAIEGVTP